MELTRAQFNRGVVSGLDVNRAEATLATARALCEEYFEGLMERRARGISYDGVRATKDAAVESDRETDEAAGGRVAVRRLDVTSREDVQAFVASAQEALT